MPKITLNELKRHISDCHKAINPIQSPVFISRMGTVYSVQRINIILKDLKKRYKLHIGNFSCHSLRKTFGRQVYNMSNENSELALVKLMEIFNHSSVSITKRYLGLRQEEILQTYDCLTFWFYKVAFLRYGISHFFNVRCKLIECCKEVTKFWFFVSAMPFSENESFVIFCYLAFLILFYAES